MKNKHWLFITPLLLGMQLSHSQEKKSLTLHDAVIMALTSSNVSALAKAKVNSAKEELQIAKNNQYPGFKVSGQYLRLSHVDVNSNLGGSNNSSGSGSSSGSSGSSFPSPSSLLLGQANLNMPIFNGFTIKNSIKATDQKYQSENLSAEYTKEQLAIQVIGLFSNLYKAQQSHEIIANNLISAKQREKDFTAMEANGIIARNDLLKAQLQVHKIELTLEDTQKNINVINHELVTLLKLPEGTQVDIDAESIRKDVTENISKNFEGSRKDLESMMMKQTAAETAVKIAKGGYYPTISFLAGYIGLNVPDLITVRFAANVGVGFSYDVASIFKNKAHVRLAKSRSEEAKQQTAILSDQIKEDIKSAQENFNYALKQSAVYDEAVVQAEENYRIVKDKYDNSLVSTNDLLDADTDQLFVKINQALAKADIAQRFYELQFAQGKLVNALNLSSN